MGGVFKEVYSNRNNKIAYAFASVVFYILKYSV